MNEPAAPLRPLRQRKLVQWGVGYLAAAWVFLQVIGFLTQTFEWPSSIPRAATLVLACGLMVALVLAGFHGAAPSRRNRITKATLLIAAILAGLSLGGRELARSTPRPSRVATDASIAVLPFRNLSNEAQNQYFTDGLTEELLNQLSHVQGLRVAARTSSFQFRNEATDLGEVGRKLNVTHVLEGSIQRIGEQVRIHATLSRVADGTHVWSERYDRQLQDVFAIEDEISTAIVNQLQPRLTGGASNAPTPRQKVAPEAHDRYLRARALFNTGHPDSLTKSIEHYRAALAIEPRYALAWAGLGESFLWLADFVLAPRDAYPKVRDAAAKALEIDPTLPEALTLQATVRALYDWEFDRARAEFTELLKRYPNSEQVHLYHAGLLVMFDPPAAIEELRTAVRLDPASPVFNGILALFYVWARQPDAAIAQQKVTDAIDPNFWFLSSALGDAYREKKMYPEAIAAYQREQQLLGGHPSAGLAVTYARMGRRDDALRIARALESLAKSQYVAPDRIAAIYANLGDADSAFRWLEEGLRVRDTWMAWMPAMPEFDPIRSDPRFREILRRMGFRA